MYDGYKKTKSKSILIGEDCIKIIPGVVDLFLNENNKYLCVEEKCDSWNSVNLSKSEVRILIEELQKLYEQMEEKKSD